MKGKGVWRALAVSLWLAALPGGVFAQESEPLTIENRIVLDKVEISLQEFQRQGEELIPWENPGQIYPGQVVSKIPVITNLGAPCYLRVRVSFSGSEEQLRQWDESCLVGLDEGEWQAFQEEDQLVYYRREALGSGEKTELFQGLRIPETWGNEMADQEFGLKLLPEAVQSANFVQNLDSESPWGELEIQDYREQNREEAYVGQEGPFLISCSPLAMELLASPEGLFFLNFNERMPGELLTGEIELSNQWDQAAELFLRLEGGENKSPQAQELQQAIAMKLTLTGEDGQEQLVYQGPLVPQEGQRQLSLGRFPPGYKGLLRMEAQIPAELDNAFTLTDVISRWIFWTSREDPVIWVPKTGDEAPVGILLGVSLGSAIALGTALTLGRRRIG
ncbi:MAG TPA: hypothetical protein IAB98_11420 [Candidatus Egerieimonas intestinavium]|uniref:Uncharacterized protein n=1 Tax=Candidatus Egerieimonas intestinavium TaxID=2840777 RepID=A0A9D1JGN0_9FIRM|nr:hypothetical protein [Candidatus Egerieimonas intestinavium]